MVIDHSAPAKQPRTVRWYANAAIAAEAGFRLLELAEDIDTIVMARLTLAGYLTDREIRARHELGEEEWWRCFRDGWDDAAAREGDL